MDPKIFIICPYYAFNTLRLLVMSSLSFLIWSCLLSLYSWPVLLGAYQFLLILSKDQSGTSNFLHLKMCFTLLIMSNISLSFLLLTLHLISSSISSWLMSKCRSLMFCCLLMCQEKPLYGLTYGSDDSLRIWSQFLPSGLFLCQCRSVILCASDPDLAALTHVASWARRRYQRDSSWPHYKHLFSVTIFSL